MKIQNRMHQGCFKGEPDGRAGTFNACGSTGTDAQTNTNTHRNTFFAVRQAFVARVAPLLPLWCCQISRNLLGRANCFLFKLGLFSLGKSLSLSCMNIVQMEVNGGLHNRRGGCGLRRHAASHTSSPTTLLLIGPPGGPSGPQLLKLQMTAE